MKDTAAMKHPTEIAHDVRTVAAHKSWSAARENGVAMPSLRSIQVRYTAVVTLLVLVIAVAVGACMDLAVRHSWHCCARWRVVYAGTAEPSILTTHDLEYVIAVAALLMTLVVGSLTWRMMGRSLRPVAQQCQLASTTSHELRNPIAGLHVQLEEALLYPDHVNPRDAIQRALSTTDRLEAIVEDLLLLARLRGGEQAHYEPIDLGALVAEEVGMPSRTMPVHAQVTGDVWVHGSRTQLIRLVSNLVSNARRHAETGVTVSVRSVDGQAVVAVTDDGAGIEPADRERVFERFVRLEDGRRRDATGSGLGLAISRDIAHAHQGTLRIEDSARGARFVLRLPLNSAIQR